MLRDFIVSLYGQNTYQVLYFLFYFYFIWAPVLLGLIFWEVWVRFVQTSFIASLPRIVLEIKVPRDIHKSPLAMEVVLAALWQGHREGNFLARFWKGQTRPWSSLEIASIGGQVHFFIWCEAYMKNFIQTQFYSQYPGVEVLEVDDYTTDIKFDLETMDVWACQFKFNKPDPYPIKTYVDYGLEKDPDEENKIDPIASMLEYMASIKKDENMWLQFIIRGHKKEKREGFFSKKTDWQVDAKNEINKIYIDIAERNKEIGKVLKEKLDDEDAVGNRTRPTKGEGDTIDAMERNISKAPFDVGMRALYTAPKPTFDKGRTGGLTGSVRLYNSEGYNGFSNDNETDWLKFPWEDFRGVRQNRRKRQMLDAYKRRMYFFAPYKFHSLVMSVEELATMFHVPGQVAATPGFERIPSKKAEAPSNLPV